MQHLLLMAFPTGRELSIALVHNERSELHKAAVSELCAASQTASIKSHLSAQSQKDMSDARHSLSMIFSTLRFLAVQGLAIRGKEQIFASYLN